MEDVVSNEEKIKRVKEIAAQKAFEAYGETIEKLLKEAGISLIEALDGTTHIHGAVLFSDDGQAVAVKCRWDFTADPVTIQRAVASTRAEGRG